MLGKMGGLIAEIGEHDLWHTRITRCRVILFQNLQGHHLGPPVFGVVSLESTDVRPVHRIADVTIFTGSGDHSFSPFESLGDQFFVI